jgi:glycosyltransferase involved in cell wall biosynthesis
MTGRSVIYHLHEVSVTPAPLRWFLVGVARLTACHLIYVSDFHRHCLPIGRVPATTVYNALDEGLANRANGVSPYHPRRDGCFRVLMLASLRDYKGVPEFVALAVRFLDRQDLNFHLVANDDETAIRRYLSNKHLPGNLNVHSRTDDPAFHYAKASLVVNLSRPDQWQETFGLTLLEAMAFGIPVIAPPVGGPLELVADGQEGFLVDSRQPELLSAKVRQLADDEALCLTMSAAALRRAAVFSRDAFVLSLRGVVDACRVMERHTGE